MNSNYIIAAVGLVLSVLTYFAGVKRTSNADVEKRARFEGQIEAKLDQLIKQVSKLEEKLSQNKDELYAEIKERIEEHERRYHHNGEHGT